VRDKRCSAPFEGARDDEIAAAGLIAIGAYVEDEIEAVRQSGRIAAFFMLMPYCCL
jgi:hypothetical protein